MRRIPRDLEPAHPRPIVARTNRTYQKQNSRPHTKNPKFHTSILKKFDTQQQIHFRSVTRIAQSGRAHDF